MQTEVDSYFHGIGVYSHHSLFVGVLRPTMKSENAGILNHPSAPPPQKDSVFSIFVFLFIVVHFNVSSYV